MGGFACRGPPSCMRKLRRLYIKRLESKVFLDLLIRLNHSPRALSFYSSRCFSCCRNGIYAAG
ncbi:hypothetical protein T12_16939 [Trichinella patagoniensis]|uniref:Uncharacterized protein n=1 Tax=Trichinella patagoniensis TaxID=990121 RepID=A0A0V0XJS0_9BILA|nr:hypothetical protein T12_16939 [Trichinella patagoniensis]